MCDCGKEAHFVGLLNRPKSTIFTAKFNLIFVHTIIQIQKQINLKNSNRRLCTELTHILPRIHSKIHAIHSDAGLIIFQLGHN